MSLIAQHFQLEIKLFEKCENLGFTLRLLIDYISGQFVKSMNKDLKD